jgi:ATP-binding cassette, subfamily C, bacteriocin exporter
MKDIKLLIITVILGICSSLLGLSTAVFAQKLIDNIVPKNDTALLIQGVMLFAGLLVLKLVLGYCQSYIGLVHGKRFNLTLIDSFFQKLLFLPKKFFDENKTGGLITRMHDSSAIHGTITFIVNTLLLNVINVAISAMFLFHYAVPLGLIALASFPIFLISAMLSKGEMRRKIARMYEASADNENNYISSIQNADLIKTHNKQDFFTHLNYATYNQLQESSMASGKAGLVFGLTSEAIGTFFYLLMLTYASYQTVVGNMTIGELTATLGVATGILWPIGALGNAVLHLQSASVAFDRMYEVISNEREVIPSDDQHKLMVRDIKLIEFRNIFFSYDKETCVLEDVSFSVRQGEIACIFGKNGAGKSTILNLIMRLYKPDSGVIAFDGINAEQLSVLNLRDRLAIVSQQTRLFEGMVIRNICLSDSEEDYRAAVSYLGELGFDKYISSIKDGYSGIISENGKNLSGGQKQIIALARALNKRPDVLLMDEATSALDGDSETFVIAKLKEFAANGGIVIMISHRLRPARAATKIVVLEDNTVTRVGPHGVLMNTENIYSKRVNEVLC